MTGRFVSNNVVFLFLIIIITIDASRIFYLPLPKIHSSHDELKSPSIVQQSETKSHEERSISDEFIPLSAMESNMYEEQDESEKRETLDWDSFVGKEEATARRHHIIVNELPPANERESDYIRSSYRDEQEVDKKSTNNQAANDVINILSNLNDNRNSNGEIDYDNSKSRAELLQAYGLADQITDKQRRNDILFVVLVAICSLVGILGLISAAIFWYKIQKRAEAALDAEYPSYGVTGPGNGNHKVSPSSTMSDRKLAQSAQMFHYQQQRQQMMAQEKAHLDTKPVESDDSDDEAPGGGDYTVYECPGLAPTGEMEVRNPLFSEPDLSLSTSAFASHPSTNNHYPQPTTTSPSSSPSKEKSLS